MGSGGRRFHAEWDGVRLSGTVVDVVSVAAGELGMKTGSGFYDWSKRDARKVIANRDRQIARQLAFLKELGELPYSRLNTIQTYFGYNAHSFGKACDNARIV